MSDTASIEFNVINLSDDNLYKKLREFGVSVGPVVGSTRKIYQKKLIKLMGGDVVDSPYPVNAEEDYSGEENETSNGREYYSENITKSTYTTNLSSSPTLRSRIATNEKSDRHSIIEGSVSFDHDRHTPSPRPSLRTVTSSTSTKYSSPIGNIRETTTLRETFGSSSKNNNDAASVKSTVTRLVVKCFFILILISALYFIYQYVYSASPFEGLENLAKEALNSAKKDGKKGT